jgi:phosphoribosylformylglycinamidine cyclo-ligase
VGVVERSRVVDGRQIQPGDVAIGIASSGFHSNGYSLVRKAVFEMGGLKGDDRIASLGNKTVNTLLLEPTRLYARPVKAVLRHYRVKQVVHGIAHITGGGLVENLARIVPDHVQVQLERGSWQVPGVFPWVQKLGGIDPAEMERVFNMGVGMVLVVSPHFADSIQRQVADLGYQNWKIGTVTAATADQDRVVLR